MNTTNYPLWAKTLIGEPRQTALGYKIRMSSAPWADPVGVQSRGSAPLFGGPSPGPSGPSPGPPLLFACRPKNKMDPPPPFQKSAPVFSDAVRKAAGPPGAM